MRSSLSSVSYLKRRGFQRSCCHDVSAPRGVLEHQILPRASSVRPAGEHRTFFVRNAPALPIPSAFQMTFRILESVTDSRGDRPGLRTHQPVRAARGDRNIPCHLHSYHHPLPPSLSPSTLPVALQLLEEVAHLSAPLLSFPHLPSSLLPPLFHSFPFSPSPLFSFELSDLIDCFCHKVLQHNICREKEKSNKNQSITKTLSKSNNPKTLLM